MQRPAWTLAVVTPLLMTACGSVKGTSDGDAGGDRIDGNPVVECDDGWTGPDCDECVTFVAGDSGSDEASGKRWDQASATLQAGIAQATARMSSDGVDHCSVWVKAGAYLPGDTRTDAFQLAPGVRLYGGFAGAETSLDQRDWAEHVTTLSGDLNQDDEPDSPELRTDNAYQVVIGADDAVLDGFTVTAGVSDGTSPYDNGAGLFNDSASPQVTHVIFDGNFGGAMWNIGTSAPTVTDCIFTNNDDGRAMGNADQSAPVVTGVTFIGNRAGGVSNAGSSAAQLSNVVFTDNDGTGGYGGGFSVTGTATPTVINAIFTGNSANAGGAIYNDSSSSATYINVLVAGNTATFDGGGAFSRHTSTPTFTNVTFYANTASDEGGAMLNQSDVKIRNSVFWDNSAPNEAELKVGAGTTSITHSIVEGGQPPGVTAENWISSSGDNPLFVDAPDDLRLLPNAPGIDAGNSLLSGLPATDLLGNARLVDGDGDGNAFIDLGPYEYVPM